VIKISPNLCRFAIYLVAVLLLAAPASGQETGEGFKAWLEGVKAEAAGQGIDATLLEDVLEGMEADPKVIELDGKQPEFTLTYQKYSSQRLSEWRISKGREMIAAYKDELAEVGKAYGVQPRFIVAIWGLETNYGTYVGGFDVIRSLATLAYASPRDSRKTFFRKELLLALKILQEGHINHEGMEGSWAGAMGQGQFMPSSFFAYAEDFNGDGRRDIWTTPVDIFASIANYLQDHRWDGEYTWGRQVTLPQNFADFADSLAQEDPGQGCRAERSLSKELSLEEWNRLGLRRLNGDDLPAVAIRARLVRPDGEAGPAYLVYDNFKRILRYNCSNYYALVVGRLADYMK